MNDRADIIGFRDGSPIRRHPDSTSGASVSTATSPGCKALAAADLSPELYAAAFAQDLVDAVASLSEHIGRNTERKVPAGHLKNRRDLVRAEILRRIRFNEQEQA